MRKKKKKKKMKHFVNKVENIIQVNDDPLNRLHSP